MSYPQFGSGTPPRAFDDQPTPMVERRHRPSSEPPVSSSSGHGNATGHAIDDERPEAFNLDEVLAEIPGGFEMAVDLAALFLIECPAMLRQMREAIHDDNPRVVRRGAHTLKSSAGIFAAHAMVEAACQVERQAAEGDVAKLSEPMKRLEVESARVMEGLKRLCAGG